jgi:hypothetical protein
MPFVCGCEAGPDEITTDQLSAALVSRVPSSSIASPNVVAGKTYLSTRRISPLASVGALNGAMGSLVYRIDGIIVNQPADGRLSISELVQMEQPGFIETLFADERAALPSVWELMATTSDPPTPLAIAPLATVQPVDISTPPGQLAKPASLAISTLPSTSQKDAANRLELTRNSDGDATTVTEADLNAAIANPGPYTRSEVSTFGDILLLFVQRATSALTARASVPEPRLVTGTVANWGAATLAISQLAEITELRSLSLHTNSPSDSTNVSISAHSTQSTALTLTGNQKLLLIEDATDDEQALGSGPLTTNGAGDLTLETWSGGVRTGTWRATAPVIAQLDQRVDLSAYADYTFVASVTSAPLARNVVSSRADYSSSGYVSYTASFNYGVTQQPIPSSGVNDEALAKVATPHVQLPPGRYVVPMKNASAGSAFFDLYPEGVVRLTRPTGQSVRNSIVTWRTTQLYFYFSDNYAGSYDLSANQLNIHGTSGTTTLIDTPLTIAQRKG